MRKLITEQDVLDSWKKRRTKLYLDPEGIVTPAAQEAAKSHQIAIIWQTPSNPGTSKPQPKSKIAKVIVGCDHGGFDLKQTVVENLSELGYEVEDVGTFSTEAVDYPDYAHLVAQKVAQNLTFAGIIIDGAGVGSAITANKVPGVRAAACYDTYTAHNSREHNYANVLTLGSRVIGVDTAKQIIKEWLSTDYGADRHGRRVDKITLIEKRYSNK